MTKTASEILDHLMQYSYDYGAGKIPTSEDPPLLVARKALKELEAMMPGKCEHQFHSDYVTDWYAIRLYDRQEQARYAHTCLLCGEVRATDRKGVLYIQTSRLLPVNKNDNLWEPLTIQENE